MDSLTVVHQVNVKAKVTERFKASMVGQMQETLKKLELELQNIEFQTKRTVSELEKLNPQGITAARQHYEAEKAKRIRAKEQLTQQIKQVGKLAIGSEVLQGTIDTLSELRVGDSWPGIFNTEILVCDDRIMEIRRNKKTDEGTSQS